MSVNVKEKQSIPSGWTSNFLHEITSLIKDGSHGTHTEFQGGIPLLSAKDIVNGEVTTDNNPRCISKEEFESIHKRYRLQDGDLLLTLVGTIGRLAVVSRYEDNYTFQRSVGILRFKNDVPNYYYQLFQTAWFQNELRKKENRGAQGGVYLGELGKIRITLPEKKERERITTVLETWDRGIEKLKRKIEIKKSVKKGLMQSLLSGNLRLLGFSGPWSKHELEDLMKPTSEKYNPISSKVDRKCIELEHLKKEDPQLLSYTSARQQKSIKSVFHAGDVLFGKLRPYLRKFLLPNFLGVCSTEIWVFKTTAKMNNVFAYYLVQTERFINIASVSSGTHMPRADWSYMRDISFTVPDDIDEQKAIANIIQIQDFEIDILKKKLQYMEDQKKYLLNNLITGTIRTPETLSIPK